MTVPSAGIAGAPGQVKRPGLVSAGLPGSVSAKALTRPRATSSSCDCMFVATVSRIWTIAAMVPPALVFAPLLGNSGTPSTMTRFPVVPAP